MILIRPKSLLTVAATVVAVLAALSAATTGAHAAGQPGQARQLPEPGGEFTIELQAKATKITFEKEYQFDLAGKLAVRIEARDETVPTLIDMVVDEANDVDAADALNALASDPALADQIAARLVDCLARCTVASSARRRLTQALAGIPEATASRALADLSHDEDHGVALTAAYILKLRNAR